MHLTDAIPSDRHDPAQNARGSRGHPAAATRPPTRRTRRRSAWLALVLLCSQSACQTLDVSATTQQYFTLSFNLSGVARTAFDSVVVSILQLSPAEEAARPGPEADKYNFDVFARLNNATEVVAGVNVSVEVRDANADTRRDILFTFLGNPFQNAEVLQLPVLHQPWARRDPQGRLIPPPPFKVQIECIKSGVAIARGFRPIDGGVLFSGVNPRVDPIGVACVPGQEAACSGDGGVVSTTDAGLPNDYTLSDLRVSQTTVTERQGGLTLSFRIRNGAAKDIGFMSPAQFSVTRDGNTTSAALAGFTLTPRGAVPSSLARREEATLTFELATTNGELAAAIGKHQWTVRLDAFEGMTADPARQLNYRLSDAPKIELEIVGPALLAPQAVAGPTELFRGESAELSVLVRNTGAARATDVQAQLSLKRADRDEPAVGLTVVPLGGAAMIAGGGMASVELKFTLTAAADAPPEPIRISATVTGRDGNDPTRALGPVQTPTDTAVQIRGPANVGIASTQGDGTTVELGGQRTLRMVIDNSAGSDEALIENPRLRFLNRAGEDVTDIGWERVSGPVGLEAQPGLARNVVPRGRTREVTFVYRALPVARGQIGENDVQASLDYVSQTRMQRASVANTARPHRVTVTFAQGPSLRPTNPEVSPRYGQAVAGLGFVNFRGSSWPALAIGAPDSANQSGAVHFWQVVPTTVNPAGVIELGRASGLAGARFGEALAPLGKWQRTTDADTSADLVIGRPGQSNLTVFGVAQSSVVTEPLPASFSPCAGCNLGEVLAGNANGVEDSDTPAERRLLVAGAPSAVNGLGRIEVVWQSLRREGAVCAVDGDCGAGAQCVLDDATVTPNVRRCVALRHRRADGDQSGERFGAAIALADVDGDGDLDIVVGSPGYKRPGDAAPRGRVRVLRAPDFLRFPATWTYFEGESEGEAAGAAIAGIGDIDGDQRDDLAIGAPSYAKDGVAVGRVYVISGATGRTLYTLDGQSWTVDGARVGERFGSAIASLFRKRGAQVADFNGDGRPDFVVGAPNAAPSGRANAGAAYVYSAPKVGDSPGRLLLRYDGQGAQDFFGAAVTGTGDLNFDGFADVVIGAPNARDASDPAGARRGAATVYYGGPFEPFQRPPGISVQELRDAEPPSPGPATRTITIGQTVRVKVMTANVGDTVLTLPPNSVTLRVRRRNSGGELEEVPATLARVTAVAHPSTLAPSPLGAPLYVPFEFDVVVNAAATPESWEVSAVYGAAGLPPVEVAPALRRPWTLQRAAQIQIVEIQTTDGDTQLGFTSINPGAPVELTALIRNTGDATVTNLAAAFAFRLEGSLTESQSLVAELRSLSATTVARGQEATAKFRVSAMDTGATAISSGDTFVALVRATGVDANSGLQVQNEQSGVSLARLRASRARLRITRVDAEPGFAFVSPGQRGVALRTTVVFDRDPDPTTTTSLGNLQHGLTFSVNNAGWTVGEGSGNRARIGACAVEPCTGEVFSLLADVPAVIAPGRVAITGVITAFDDQAGVNVRGFSDTALADSTAHVEVLGTGTPVASFQSPSEPSFGSALAFTGDLTGDDINDFAVGIPGAEGGRGQVHLLDGKRLLSGDPAVLLNAGVLGDASRRGFGAVLAGGYNFTASPADAFADVLVGAPREGGTELPGGFLLPLRNGPAIDAPVALPAPGGRAAFDEGGSALATGDLNFDGCPDSVIGFPLASDASAEQTGAVCVRFGTVGYAASGGGGATTCAPGCTEVCTAGPAPRARFGAAVATFMPSGQGKFSLAVGAPGVVVQRADVEARTGAVYAYNAVTCAGFPFASLVLPPGATGPDLASLANHGFGASLAPTRVPALVPTQAKPEALIVGASGDPGTARCDTGRPCPAGTTCTSRVCVATTCTTDATCGAGNRCVAGRCDRKRVGAAYMLTGQPPNHTMTRVATGEAPDDAYASVVAAAGDVDGDGVGDFAVGAPGAQYRGVNTGRVDVFSGRDALPLYRFGNPTMRSVGRALAGVGRLARTSADYLAIGAEGAIVLAAGLGRSAAASLRIDAVRPVNSSVAAGQSDAAVLVELTNVGLADAFLVTPTLTFRPGAADAAPDAAYTVTRRFTQVRDASGTVTAEQEITPSSPLTLAAGTRVTMRLVVSIPGTAAPGAVFVDGALSARSGSAVGSTLTVAGADIIGRWTVQDAPQPRILRVEAPDATVFQGQRAARVRVTLVNQSNTPPTAVTVRAMFRNTTTNASTSSSYTQTQLTAPASVLLDGRTCTTAPDCTGGRACIDGRCATTVDLDVDVAPNAALGEQELSAEVVAPPLATAVTGPTEPSARAVWTVLPGGVLEIQSVAFDPPRAAVSAGQRGVRAVVRMRNTGSIALRDVTPTLTFPAAPPTQPNARVDLAGGATIEPARATTIEPGQSLTVAFNIDFPAASVVQSLGPVIMDATAVSRDAFHAPTADRALERAQFELQQPASPRLTTPTSARLQGLVYRGERSVEIALGLTNGSPLVPCTNDAQCGRGTCVAGGCSPAPTPPTASWTEIGATLCLQNPAGTAAVAGAGCVPLTTLGHDVPAELAGNTQANVRYEFDAPPNAPLGQTRAVLRLSGRDKNTGLPVPELVIDGLVFTMRRDNAAGALLGPPLAAPEGAVRFGASMDAAPVAGPRKAIVVVGAPESDPDEGGNPRGRAFVLSMQAAQGDQPAQLGVVAQFQGETHGDRLGSSVTLLRDATRNARYIAVAAPNRSEGGIAQAGVVYLYDAQTLALVSRIIGAEENLRIGRLGSGANVDGDSTGIDELLIGLPEYNNAAGRVMVHAGTAPFGLWGAPLDGPPGSRFGRAAVAAAGFGPTGSGLFVGAPLPSPSTVTGALYAFTGPTLAASLSTTCGASFPASHSPTTSGRRTNFADAVAVLPSTSGSACPELAIGAPLEDNGALAKTGAVYVATSAAGYFAAPGPLVLRGERVRGEFGAALRAVGDWNGDASQLSELAVGAPSATVGTLASPTAYPTATAGVGAVHVHLPLRTAPNGPVSIFRAEGERTVDQQFGATLASVDLNDDGVPELIVGAPGAPMGSNGRVFVFQGGQRQGAELRVDMVTSNGRSKVARGVPVAPWPGIDVRITVTNAGKSAALAARPALRFPRSTGGDASGISVRTVSPCLSTDCTQPEPKDIPSEGQQTWIYRLDISSVASLGAIAIVGSVSGTDALTTAPISAVGASTPDFLEVVSRNALLAVLTGEGNASETNTTGFGAAVAGLDVEGDGYSELAIADPRSDGTIGGVALYTLRGAPTRLAYIAGTASDSANRTFGRDATLARVGDRPVVFVSQVDDGASTGAVFAYPLECSASLCEVTARAPVGTRRFRVDGGAGKQFGTALAWVGQETINGESNAFLAVSSSPAESSIDFLSVTRDGMLNGPRSVFTRAGTVDGGAATLSMGCGAALAAMERSGERPALVATHCAELGGDGLSGVLALTPQAGTAAHYFRGPANNPPPNKQDGAIFGASLAILPDIAAPADNRPELLIGWPAFDSNVAPDAGRFELWRGAATTPAPGVGPHLSVDGTESNGALGAVVARLGDIDGDGVPDFAVAQPGTRSVRIYSGLSTEGFKRVIAHIQGPAGDAAYEGFGERVFGIGDVNGDGFADIAIAAPRATVNNGTRNVRGAVYVYSGGSL